MTRNPYVWGALALCVGLLFGAVYVPEIADVMNVRSPSVEGWGIVALMSLLPLVVGQIVLAVRARWGETSELR